MVGDPPQKSGCGALCGVMVDNAGPDGAEERDGQGFGGGKGFVSHNKPGLPGMVILSFE